MDEKKTLDVQRILRAEKIGIWRVERENGQTVRLYADDVMDDLLGVTGPMTPEQRNEFFAQHIHPDDRELFQEYAEKQTETQTEIVYRYLHPVRGEMIVRCSGGRDTTIRDRIVVIGTHQDISDFMRLEQEKQAERRLAEQNLTLRREREQQETYYRELLDVQNCGLLAYTLPDHKVIHMNAEALRMYAVKDLAEGQAKLGSILSGVYYPDPEISKKLASLRDRDGAVDYECVLHKGTPSECHVMAKTKVIWLPGGKRAAVTTFLDVSDMIMLRRALQQAQEGSRAKSAFLFAMSHDLRTPMNAIIGYADLLESHWGQAEPSWEYLQKLKQASRFLLGLIGNVLEVSRIESGKETLHEAPWDLRELDGAVDVLMENEIVGKRLQVTRRIDLPCPYVLCDAMKLREILMNLLSNAVKYTPEGGSIRVTLEQIPPAGAEKLRLRMAVEDTGIGIAKEYIPHLFEAFSRERDSSESGIMGTGLGLRIVKSFADLMNGTVSVKSEPGKGSCFAVELPLRPAEKENGQPGGSREWMPVCLENHRVLLTEDNALNAEIAATILRDAGMKVEIAGDGRAALQMLQDMPEGYYEVILMDIQMPRMNGYEAARAIRALPGRRAGIPIVAMTANAFEEDRQAAFDAGMNAYAPKPIEPVRLLAILSEMLQGGEKA